MQDETNDVQLIKGIARQNHDDFAEFTSRYMLPIMNYVHRYIQNRSHIEDIAQEVFLKVWQKAYQWKSQKAGSPRAWLYRIAYHQCIDLIRQQKPQTEEIENLADYTTPEETLLNELKEKQFNRAMESLPERQRTALYLYTYQGLSNKEVASTLAISIDALESLLSRARRQLRKNLKLNTQSEIERGTAINE